LPDTNAADDSTDEQSELSANEFDIELDDELLEAISDDDIGDSLLDDVTDDGLGQLADRVARQWDTPKGEWWP